jgi:hypothetical protein
VGRCVVRAYVPNHGHSFITVGVATLFHQEGGFRLIDVLSCKSFVNNLKKAMGTYFDADAGYNLHFQKKKSSSAKEELDKKHLFLNDIYIECISLTFRVC